MLQLFHSENNYLRFTICNYLIFKGGSFIYLRFQLRDFRYKDIDMKEDAFTEGKKQNAPSDFYD